MSGSPGTPGPLLALAADEELRSGSLQYGRAGGHPVGQATEDGDVRSYPVSVDFSTGPAR